MLEIFRTSACIEIKISSYKNDLHSLSYHNNFSSLIEISTLSLSYIKFSCLWESNLNHKETLEHIYLRLNFNEDLVIALLTDGRLSYLYQAY